MFLSHNGTLVHDCASGVALAHQNPDGACVQIEIERTAPEIRAEKRYVFLNARDERGATVIVKLDRLSWEGIQAEWPSDPFAGVEAVARHGHWRTYRGERVWRVDFI